MERNVGLKFGTPILVALLVVSCGSENDGVRPPTGPAAVPGATVTRVELDAPGTIAPGETVQLTATAVKSDGTRENVSAQAQWLSSSQSVLEITPAGVARALTVGETTISVVYQQRSANRRTIVTPPGTYRLSGRVTDGGAALSRVSIAVLDGVGAGLETTTDEFGFYKLYGVSGRIRLHAKHDGYFNSIQELDVNDHRTFDFGMTPDKARLDLRGAYRVTISRSACAAAGMPASRTYGATLTQDGGQLDVDLSGADFIVTRGRGSSFRGFVDGTGGVTFEIGDAYLYYYYYGQFDIVERFTSNSSFIISGQVHATATPTAISGTMSGDFLIAQGASAPFTRIQARCTSPSNVFEMVRQ